LRLDTVAKALEGRGRETAAGAVVRAALAVSSRSPTCTSANIAGGSRLRSQSRHIDARKSPRLWAPMAVELTVNGHRCAVEVEARTTCSIACATGSVSPARMPAEHGVCGACTVLLEGVAVARA
jgi:hypothetical protein